MHFPEDPGDCHIAALLAMTAFFGAPNTTFCSYVCGFPKTQPRRESGDTYPIPGAVSSRMGYFRFSAKSGLIFCR